MKAAKKSAITLCHPRSERKKVTLMEISPRAFCNVQQLQRAGVVLHVDNQRTDQRVDEGGQEEDG